MLSKEEARDVAREQREPRTRPIAPPAPGQLSPEVRQTLADIQLVEVLTEEQAAVYLRPGKPLAVPTLRDWRLRGIGDGLPGPPFVKIGGLVGYRKAALDAWIEQQERKTTSDRPGKRASSRAHRAEVR